MYSSATPIGSAVRSTTPIRSTTPVRAARVLNDTGISAVSSSATSGGITYAKTIEPTSTIGGVSYVGSVEPSYPTYAGGISYVQDSGFASTTAAVTAGTTTYSRAVEPTVMGGTTYLQASSAAPAPIQSTVTSADPGELAAGPIIGGQAPLLKSTTTTTTYTYAPQPPPGSVAQAPAVTSSTTYMPATPAGGYTYSAGSPVVADGYTYSAGAQPMAGSTFTYAAGSQPVGMPAMGAAMTMPAVTSTASPFVFGAQGPQVDAANSSSAAATAEPDPTYTVGQGVDVWSNSENSWIAAEVIAVAPDGTVTARYGANQKDISPAYLKQYLRPGAKTLTIPGPAKPPVPTYAIGQAVEVFSKSDGAWVGAEVKSINPDGVVTVKWGRNQKDIAPEFLYEYLRPAAPVFTEAGNGYAPPATCAQPPMTMGPGGPSPAPAGPAYGLGEAVEVFSKSEGSWVPAQVVQVEGDGTVIVRYGHNQKNIPPTEYDRYLRKPGAAMVPVDTLYMPPTSGPEPTPAQSASYVAPPPNNPMSSAVYEAPPTAFGPTSLAAPPTAYGATGFPTGVEAPPTAYVQPPTLPGGYS